MGIIKRIKGFSLILPAFLFLLVGLHSSLYNYVTPVNRPISSESVIVSIPEDLDIQNYINKFFIPLPDNYATIDRGFIINIPDKNEEAVTTQGPTVNSEQPSVNSSYDNGDAIMILPYENGK